VLSAFLWTLLAGCVSRGHAAVPPAASFRLLREEPCPGSPFACITLLVPRDHAVADGPRWEVRYAIRRATRDRLGTLVVITGGPGSSGIALADRYVEDLDPAVVEHYDLVFLDQRGVGGSRPIDCPQASAEHDRAPADPSAPARRAAVAAAASRYVARCLAEAHVDPAELPYYATRQAVEDLEAFRRYLGIDQFHLYGESYGTQYAQTYAAAHPEAIAALYLDGPVDLATDGITFYAEQARALERALGAVLADCAAEPACQDDAGGPPAAAYDSLRARLSAAPRSFDLVREAGTKVTRELSLEDLENAVVDQLSTPRTRSALQRALNAAFGGDLAPLGRLAYESIGLDPETLRRDEPADSSDGMYYAVECQDYAFYAGRGGRGARFAAWIADGDRVGVPGFRVRGAFYGDLPCLWWPAQPAHETRPGPSGGAPYPTFVLAATLDPAAPMAGASRIADRLSRAYVIQTINGAHVSFGRGDLCPDRIITDHLLKGILPRQRITLCESPVASTYLPNPRATIGAYRDVAGLMASMQGQIVEAAAAAGALEDGSLTVGCKLGGSIEYRRIAGRTELTLAGCEFTRGAPMSGAGAIEDGTRTFRLSVRLPQGTIRYTRQGDARPVIRGSFRTIRR
jgi:pimeloyl-ACP methyl ester carboxylesterase